MASGGISIGTINLAGLFKNINQQFSFVESFKELIDNSLDANAKNITIRLSPTEFVFSDNGDGLSETSIVGKMMQLFLETQNNEGKRGNKGIGLKAALIKLTNYKNIDILTKTAEGAMYRVCFPIQTVIEKNDISLIKYSKATLEDEKVWFQYNDDSSVCSSGTMIFTQQRDICQSIFDQVHLEELSKELEMVYSNFLHKTELKLKYYQVPDLICKPHPLFNLVEQDKGWKPYRIRISSIRKEFIFYFNNRWYQIFPSSKKDKIKEFSGDFSFFNLKLNCYWWYTKDLSMWQNLLGDTEQCGFYSCREQKFSELGFKLPEKAQGDFSLQREITSKSVWILEFGARLDELMGTIANKSKLSKSHMDPYIYNCIVEFARFILVKAIEEMTISTPVPQPQMQSQAPKETNSFTQIQPALQPISETITILQAKKPEELEIEEEGEKDAALDLSKDSSSVPSSRELRTPIDLSLAGASWSRELELEDDEQIEDEGEEEEEDLECVEDEEEDLECEEDEEEDLECEEDEVEKGAEGKDKEVEELLFFIRQKIQKLLRNEMSEKQKAVCKELGKKLLFL